MVLSNRNQTQLTSAERSVRELVFGKARLGRRGTRAKALGALEGRE